jgi:hypothetical protein
VHVLLQRQPWGFWPPTVNVTCCSITFTLLRPLLLLPPLPLPLSLTMSLPSGKRCVRRGWRCTLGRGSPR